MELVTQEKIPSVLTPGKILTRIRGQLKMNQKDFGRFLGASRQTICAWELSNAIPIRATLSRVQNKLRPYLTPEELIILENWGIPTEEKTNE